MTQQISGTREWAVASLNIHLGCSHRCRYCYARAQSERRKLCEPGQWGTDDYNRLKKRPFTGFDRKYDGTVMFPTTHDLHPDFLPEILEGIRRLLAADNTILLVSKPHLSVIKAICEEFHSVQTDQIKFRFTIGAMNDKILSYWEPGAPTYAERLASLKHAYDEGFYTSVSCEPMLDSPHVHILFYNLEPFVSADGVIWIGKMNEVRKRVDPNTSEEEIARIEAGQTDERIWEIYKCLKDNPKVRWKESIKKVVGLPLATEAGTDE